MGGGKYAFTYSAILIRSPGIFLSAKNKCSTFHINSTISIKEPLQDKDYYVLFGS